MFPPLSSNFDDVTDFLINSADRQRLCAMEEEGTFPTISCHLAHERFVLSNVKWLYLVLLLCLMRTQFRLFLINLLFFFCVLTELELSLTDSDEDVSDSEDSAADGDISGDVVDSDDVVNQLR